MERFILVLKYLSVSHDIFRNRLKERDVFQYMNAFCIIKKVVFEVTMKNDCGDV